MKTNFYNLIPSLRATVRPFEEAALAPLKLRISHRVEVDTTTGEVTLGWDYPPYSNTPKHSMVLPINLGPLVELPVPSWIRAVDQDSGNDVSPSGSWCREADAEAFLMEYVTWARTVMTVGDYGREMKDL